MIPNLFNDMEKKLSRIVRLPEDNMIIAFFEDGTFSVVCTTDSFEYIFRR